MLIIIACVERLCRDRRQQEEEWRGDQTNASNSIMKPEPQNVTASIDNERMDCSHCPRTRHLVDLHLTRENRAKQRETRRAE